MNAAMRPREPVVITPDQDLAGLLAKVRSCRACEAHLPSGPRPVLQVGASARILIAGQAPGVRAHNSGVPWDDPSGDRLRAWTGLDKMRFYDASEVAIIPMGFCYPGRGRGGDLPPRRECAQLWLDQLLTRLPRLELTLLIGLHSQRHFLGRRRKPSLTETVRAWREFGPDYLPLPHPSARNTPWFQRNPWFEQHLLPELKQRVASFALAAHEHDPKPLAAPGALEADAGTTADHFAAARS
jgi:uracil-DNA glycosylase